MGVKAVIQFQRAGGTHLVLVDKPYKGIFPERDGFPAEYAATLELAEKVRDTDIQVAVIVGPHPACLTTMMKRGSSLEEAKEVMISGIEAASKLVQEGKASGIGEVGLPHYPVDEDVTRASWDILEYALQAGKELDCAIVLHTASEPGLSVEIAELCRKVGIPLDKVVKHFSGPWILPEENHGLFPSVLASRDNVNEAVTKGSRFMMETDYIDDPRRPGAVLGPKTVPKQTIRLLEAGIDAELLHKVHVDHPAAIYGLEYD